MAQTAKEESIDRRRYLRYLGIVAAGAPLAGCTGDTDGGDGSPTTGGTGSGSDEPTSTLSSDQKRSDQTLVIGMGSAPETLDPHQATRLPEKEIIASMAEPLFRDDPEQNPAPHLVSEFETNDDATQFTFTLEEGITFHDGEPFDAKSAVWNLTRIKENSPTAADIAASQIENIEATGDLEFVVEYAEPFPLLPRRLTIWNFSMVSQAAVEKAGKDFGQTTVVGTGPYKFESWERGSAIITSRFEDYSWGPDFLTNQGPGYVGGFRFEHHPEAATLLNELTTGNVDGSKSVLLAYAKDIENHQNTKLARKQFTRQAYLCPNVQKEPFNDPEVRRAVVNAINKEAVIQSVVSGEGYKIWNCVTPFHTNSLGPEESKQLGQVFDPEKARQRLENAGWTNDQQGQVRTKNGNELAIDFFTYTIEREKRVGKIVAPMLQNVGFNVNLKILESGTLYNKVASGEHDLLVMALGNTYGLAWLENALHGSRWYTQDSCCNFSIWQNDEFDTLIENAKRETDPQKRTEQVKGAQRIVLKAAPVAPIFGYNKIFGYKNEVGGVQSWTQHPWWPVEQYNQRMELFLK